MENLDESSKDSSHARCISQLPHDCLVELHTGRFDGAQQHRATEQLELPRLPHFRLVTLITSIWRNFQRRQHLETQAVS